MDERFRDCPKECPMENNSKWLAEKACEIIRKLEAENARLKLQLEKVLEVFPVADQNHPCPSTIGLNDSFECGLSIECQQCWRDALEGVGSEVKIKRAN